jgi:hypothetical protein
MRKSISLFNQLHKKAIFYGIVGESGWFRSPLGTRKTTAENTKLTETVLISVNPCLISLCLSVLVAIPFRVNLCSFVVKSMSIKHNKVRKTNPILSSAGGFQVVVKQRVIKMNPYFWPKNPKANFTDA